MNTLTVEGMSCEHCRSAVLKAVSAVPGVTEVRVDLPSGTLEWAGDASLEGVVREAVVAIGFNVK